MPRYGLFLVIFTLSGFSGLIYESIWSHYLKLYLGHSSYAQALVLLIFMGGMAIGSALASKFSGKLSNLILWYGIAEGVIGIFGLAFHGTFVFIQSTSYEVLFPALGGGIQVSLLKWLIASLLILPQSIILGATFPLLAAGILRKFNINKGKAISTLYFVNSLGAAIGILCNAFILIPNLGLPGAALTAGLINIFLAIIIYFITKGDSYPATKLAPMVGQQPKQATYIIRLLLITSLLTGMASFMYEIAWIRMLTMVLGASTHSFEIMLSAFILGLALGGIWIRKRIDRLSNPLKTLGFIQILMGTLAVLTLPLYSYTYDLMSFFVTALSRSQEGYILFSIFSLTIALIIMLPATICAGTTLPLITYSLLKNNQGEKSIGRVYAMNTVGAIAGILIALLLVMPNLGLKWAVVAGGLIDVVLGIYLLTKFSTVFQLKFQTSTIITSSLCVSFLCLSLVDLSVEKMASGVFRYGVVRDSDRNILFHKDGKTSTVAINSRNSYRSLINNGKPDAAINLSTDKSALPSKDESTMTLLGTLPFVYNPEARHIANIGLGSGLTAHTLLGNKNLLSLDSIEIEHAVYEAAEFFRPRVDRLFTDKRSNVVIDDAKTYFARNQKKYDVIVSEPPNPWVSGVSSLFSEEFYREMGLYLNDNGVLVQWVHTYEMNPKLVATIYNALRINFTDIHIYKIDSDASDIAFIASKTPLKSDYESPFKHPLLVKELERFNIKKDADLTRRLIAKTQKLDYLFNIWDKQANSDFFPILDTNAPQARFIGGGWLQLRDLANSPFLDRLINNQESSDKDRSTEEVIRMFNKGVGGFIIHLDSKESFDRSMIDLINSCSSHSTTADISTYINSMSNWLIHETSLNEQSLVFNQLSLCDKVIDKKTKSLVSLYTHWSNKNYTEVFNSAESIILSSPSHDSIQSIYKMYLTSALILNKTVKVQEQLSRKIINDYEALTLLSLVNK